ncbi:MAG: DEAD/DEAH box helicase family protein, partial [Deltaproteobacteria bacterium]|nr:DEAD/DEAH box helicase family protein [Deltaproteobacteria bacterium]
MWFAMNIDDILTKLRAEARSEREKGDSFERLMIRFLKTYPVYDSRFTDVWQWRDFAGRGGIAEGDTGIDIVARTKEGQFWAVQAKFYQEETLISKADLDGFLATSGRSFNFSGKRISFAKRLLVSTTNAWSSNAETAIRDQTPPVSRISLTDLRAEGVDWKRLDEGFYGNAARPARKELRDYQREAVEKAREHYASRARGKVILPCGTGKTLQSLKIAESETDGRGFVLFLAPSIALVGQTLREWSVDAAKPFFGFCVCSDPTVSEGSSRLSDEEDGDSYRTVDLPLPVTTSPKLIAEYLSQGARLHGDRLTIVFSTYHSAGAVSAGAKKAKVSFDIMVCD